MIIHLWKIPIQINDVVIIDLVHGDHYIAIPSYTVSDLGTDQEVDLVLHTDRT